MVPDMYTLWGVYRSRKQYKGRIIMAKKKEYRGWSLFNDVGDSYLRTWNRCAVVFNIGKVDIDTRDGYLQQLNGEGQHQVMAMLAYIHKVGYEKARINVFGKLKAVGGVH
jgi:hypothetical protein